MQFSILGLVIESIKMALSVTLLFIGSTLLYWGIYGIIFGFGILSPLIPVLLFGGCLIILPGISVAKHFGENLKDRYLALVSLAYLIVAHSLNFLIFYMLHPNWISTFWLLLHQINLSNAILDIAFLVGYLRKKQSKIHFH